jgi:hypothetical protein
MAQGKNTTVSVTVSDGKSCSSGACYLHPEGLGAPPFEPNHDSSRGGGSPEAEEPDEREAPQGEDEPPRRCATNDP